MRVQKHPFGHCGGCWVRFHLVTVVGAGLGSIWSLGMGAGLGRAKFRFRLQTRFNHKIESFLTKLNNFWNFEQKTFSLINIRQFPEPEAPTPEAPTPEAVTR